MSAVAEPDQAPGAPHPRETYALAGHEAAESELAGALAGGRMHHAWLIGGPRGLGKATLAYRFARRLLGARQDGPRPLDVSPDDPVARRIAANAHPDLFVLRRSQADRGDRYRREIVVEDVRALGAFFALKPAEGGWRVAIVDVVDDLNRNAANALLKTLEEPPPRAVLLLLSHAPGAALATIRSRCRRLTLRPLSHEQMKAAAGGAEPAVMRFAEGRPGRAAALAAAGVSDVLAAVERGMAGAEKAGVAALLPLAHDRGAGASSERLDLTIDVAQDWLRQHARERVDAGLSAEAYASAWFDLETLRGQAEELNLDPVHGLARTAAILARAARAA